MELEPRTSREGRFIFYKNIDVRRRGLYHAPFMLKPDLIDPKAFAVEKRRVWGSMQLDELDERVRLHEFLSGRLASLQIQLQGGIDGLQRPYLDLDVKGSLPLICQCCMQPTVFDLDEQSRIVLFDDEESLDKAMQADEDLEGLVAEQELSVRALVEDQILMAMPYSPRHEACSMPTPPVAGQEKTNPFAVLAGLKSNK